MDIVGVGGAALPAGVGDRLVMRGINLILGLEVLSVEFYCPHTLTL